MTIFRFVVGCGLVAGAVLASSAQAPAGPPAGATGICKDGTYSNAASKSGACAGHKGVQTWYSATPTKASAATKTPAAAPAPTPTPAASVPSRPAPTAATSTPSMPAPTATATSAKKGPAAAAAAKTAQPGGGPGLVWVNTKSNVYHCYGDTYYGKTESGSVHERGRCEEPRARAGRRARSAPSRGATPPGGLRE